MEYLYSIGALIAINIVYIGGQILIKFLINRIKLFFTADSLEIKLETAKNSESETILIKAKGVIVNQGKKIQFLSLVTDITEGKGKSVLCFISEFQKNNVYCFSNIISLPFENTSFDWTPLGAFFPEICTFPKTGKRKLKMTLLVANSNGSKITESSVETDYYNQQRGYEETNKYKDKLFKLELTILASIAASDNDIDIAEIHFLEMKKEQFLKEIEDDKKEKLKVELDLIISQYLGVRGGTQKFMTYSCVEQFQKISTEGEKYKLVKNCTDIMSVDGKIESEELLIIDKISQLLKLDMDKVNALKDVHILKTSGVSSSNKDILGIKAEWSDEQTREHLKKSFIKWNARMQNCSNKNEISNIQNMIDLITEAMRDYEEVAKAQ